MGNDVIQATLLPQTIQQLAGLTPGETWVMVINGGPGNDQIHGSPGRDRIDGGPGSDTLHGYGGDDRMWGDFFDGDPHADADRRMGGAGNDDLVGGLGANYLYAWSRDPDPGRDVLQDGPSVSFGVYIDSATGRLYDDDGDLDNDGYLDEDAGLPATQRRTPRGLEDTGLDRMLGVNNPAGGDVLYAGTGLDFLYGNGGGNDVLVSRHGTQFGAGDSTLSENDQWKQLAKSTDRAWYLAGSGGDDEIDIDYVTNPYNPLYGRHLVTFATAGSFDPRFNGFDSFTAFDRNNDPIHDSQDRVLDIEALLLNRSTGLPRLPGARRSSSSQP